MTLTALHICLYTLMENQLDILVFLEVMNFTSDIECFTNSVIVVPISEVECLVNLIVFSKGRPAGQSDVFLLIYNLLVIKCLTN